MIKVQKIKKCLNIAFNRQNLKFMKAKVHGTIEPSIDVNLPRGLCNAKYSSIIKLNISINHSRLAVWILFYLSFTTTNARRREETHSKWLLQRRFE
jgi:hypothetical protein